MTLCNIDIDLSLNYFYVFHPLTHVFCYLCLIHDKFKTYVSVMVHLLFIKVCFFVFISADIFMILFIPPWKKNILYTSIQSIHCHPLSPIVIHCHSLPSIAVHCRPLPYIDVQENDVHSLAPTFRCNFPICATSKLFCQLNSNKIHLSIIIQQQYWLCDW